MNKKIASYFFIFLSIDLFFFLPVLISKNIIGSVDAYQQFYPYVLHLYEGLKNFKIPFWWHYTGLGYPFVGVSQSGALYPLNYLYLIIPPPLGYNVILIFHFFLLQVFSFLYMKYLLKRDNLAFLGTILFSFNVYNFARIDIYSFTCAAPYFLASLYILHKAIEDSNKNKIFYSVLISLVLGLEFLSGYPQLFVYNILFLGFYTILGVILRKDFGILLIFIGALVFVVPLIFVQLFATLSMYDLSLRVKIKDFFYNQFSYHPSLLLTYLFPNIFGGMGRADYWGPEKEYVGFWREFINYTSLIIIPATMIASYAVFRYKKKNFYYIILLGIVSLLLSLGKYSIVSYLLYFVPGYSDLRVPARNMFAFNFVLSVLTSIGITYILKIMSFSKSKMKTFLKLYIFPYLLFTFPFMIYFWITKKLGQIISVLLQDLLLTFYFLGIFLVLTYLIYSFHNKILKKMVFLAILLVLEKSFLFFSNPNFNMSVQNLQDSDKMIKSLASKNNLGNHFLMLDDEIPFNLFSIVTKQRVLNIYDPFVNVDYYYLFNIDWSGRIGSIYPLVLPRNNLLLSMFGVNFIAESSPTYINICKNLYNQKNLEIIKLKEYQVFRNKESVIIYFSNVNNSDLVVVNCKIKIPSLNINQKLRKIINEDKELMEINVQDMYKISLNIETIGNINIERGSIDFLVPLLLPSQTTLKNLGDQKIKIEIKPISKYREIKMGNIDLYLYPRGRVLLLGNQLKENRVYRCISSNSISSNPISSGPISSSLISSNPLVYQNLNSMQNIFSVEKVKIIENIVELKKMALLSQFDPSKVAFIEKDELKKLGEYLKNPEYEFLKKINGKIKLENIRFNKLRIERISFFEQVDKVVLDVDSVKPAFLVINNSYYKGWRCRIGKTEIPVLKVNGIVQGIIVPPGKHNITLEFKPWYKNFVFLSYLFLIFYLVLLIKIRKISEKFVKK